MDWPEELEPLPDLDRLTETARRRLLRGFEAQERAISARRHRVHRKIDALGAELGRRIGAGEIRADGRSPWRDPLSRVFAGTGRLPAESGALPRNLRRLSPTVLRELLGELRREEDDVSLRRRILHFRIDLLRWLDSLR